MTPFEQELKKALARQEAPLGFAERVLAKVAEGKPAPRRRWIDWRLAVAAAATLLIGGGAVYQQHARAIRGEMAKQKLMLALEIAGSKLQQAQKNIRQVEDSEAQK